MNSSLLHPRENPDLTGHEGAERTLLEAFNGGKLPHAWLIGGVRGLGKATLAYRFARFLLMQEQAAEDTGGLFGDAAPRIATSLAISPDHPVFKRIVSGGHADLCVIEPTNRDEQGKEKAGWEIRLWQIQHMAAFLRQTPAESAWRIVLLDSADDMNTNAANALLKLLEEPPANTVMLLISHNPGRLLPTIRSRCRALNLRPLPDSEVRKIVTSPLRGSRGAQRLGGGYDKEGYPPTELLETGVPAIPAPPQRGSEEMEFALALAAGSPGMAMQVLAQEGLELYRDMVEALSSLPKPDALAMQDFAASLTKKENMQRWQLLTHMFGWFIASTVTGGAGREFAGGERELRARLLQHSSIDRLAEIWENATRAANLGDALNMDRQQTAMEMFGMLQTGT